MKARVKALLCAGLLLLLCGCAFFTDPAVPFVKFQGIVYRMDTVGDGGELESLPDSCTKLGVIEAVAAKEENAANNSTSCCAVGELIYSAPETDCVYVYTAVFSDTAQYRFLRFRAA